MRDAWRRAQAWEPQFVAADLHNARELAEEYRRDAVIWRAGLDQDPVGSPERELAERDVAAAEHLAAVSAARVEALERIQDVRTDWLERTRDVQERAAFAGDELERRGLDRDTADPVGEQQELFTIGNGEPAADADAEVAAGVVSDADAATSAAQTMRGLDPAQRQFDLDGVHRAVPAATASERVATEHQTTGAPSTSRRRRDHRQRRSEIRAGRGRRAACRRANRSAAHAPAQQPEAAPDGYAELFAETERAAEREREQPALFEVQPTPVDVAAAQPLHLDDSPGDAAGARAVDTAAERTDGRGHRRGRLADRLPGHPASRDHRRDACRTRRPSRRRGGRASPSRGRPGRRRPRPRGIPRRRSTRAPTSTRARACPPNSSGAHRSKRRRGRRLLPGARPTSGPNRCGVCPCQWAQGRGPRSGRRTRAANG